MNKLSYQNYYFLGAGGIGMSALIRYFAYNGKNVLGYDKTSTQLTKTLENEGIKIHYTDSPELIPAELTPENTLVIYTPAVPSDLKELAYFKEKEFDLLKRAEVLGDLTRDTFCIGVAGTHGKTTTTTLLGHILHYAKLESTAFCGGISQNYGSNLIGHGQKITVVEADEYDRSFLKLSPNISIVTSVDADHLDIYQKEEDFVFAFQEYALKVTPDNLFVNYGLPFEDAVTYGISPESDICAQNIRVEKDQFVFDIKHYQETISDIKMDLPGRHNIKNATAAFAVAKKLGLDSEIIKEAIESFKGIKRRFTRHKINGKVYIDDYAHHPTEINAAISAARELYPSKKMLVVFQPHLFSRTKDFADEFALSLQKADTVLLLDIYPYHRFSK
ncbi:MAG: UDP-N-acetylmuramate--L-alanine ligase [Flavobacteriaceae bacterium]|nr:MAG: UDP-N-acetylmuramate--L-alanine ligase [Flavobacteriaceae bacterium]